MSMELMSQCIIKIFVGFVKDGSKNISKSVKPKGKRFVLFILISRHIMGF
jgi:hypothetical protein